VAPKTRRPMRLLMWLMFNPSLWVVGGRRGPH
jgi:hypothetical protein